MGPRTRSRWLALALACALVPAAAQAQGPQDVTVKASYLYKFSPFVTWPDKMGPSKMGTDPSSGPFTLCIVGDDPFGDQIDRAVAGQSLDGRPIQVLHIETIGPKSDCAIAYLGGSRAESVSEALRAVRGTPTLTVTDEGDPPGIISFAVAEGHVRFRIDQVQARENGLVISSKLLDLALSVRTLPGEGAP